MYLRLSGAIGAMLRKAEIDGRSSLQVQMHIANRFQDVAAAWIPFAATGSHAKPENREDLHFSQIVSGEAMKEDDRQGVRSRKVCLSAASTIELGKQV